MTPTRATIFAYQVGFGDCFLVCFHYPDRDRHMLVDFGTTGLPKDAERDRLTTIARDIKERCGGRLEVVVATHRHADHISGFARSAGGDGPGDIIRTIPIDIVVQPWTEAPKEAIDALGPVISSPKTSMARRQRSLQAMHAMSKTVLKLVGNGRSDHLPRAVRDQLCFIGQDNIANRSAVENLMSLGGERFYAYHGMDLPLGTVLPGVVTHVLGPPTLRQTEEIRKSRQKDPEEFWMLAARQLDDGYRIAVGEDPVFPAHPTFPASKLPREVRWFARRTDEVRAEQLLSLVRSLDRALNNTSLILLLKAGSRSLLFPGDAQIENWAYALQSPLADLLDDVDLYKVGHHGSRNATPRRMWQRLRKRGGAQKPDRLTTVMSTMPGKHGSASLHTEVPRETLLQALRAESDLHSTHEADPERLFQEISLDLT